MNIFKKYLAVTLTFGSLAFSGASFAQEAPDALVKRISLDVLNTAKADKSIQGGNKERIKALVEEKIMPYVNFEHTTALAAGRYWREATPEQQKQLIEQFRILLIRTYSGAFSQVHDQTIELKPMRSDAADTDVIVRSAVVQSGREPIQLDYHMEKIGAGWKIYDVNVLGAWLVETYKGTFASEIGKSGIDGLIKTLTEKNQKLAAAKAAK
ncbi:MlaC/ttg2D family ABC transporter substrate-binding protein [Paraherbaspirillum soli]|uniref:Phospholipid-binding protein MlaC n=1 Tax=Paraherbaspirillum soli TaxID=631222 RepID=A0ABW0M7H1_9BURK